MINAETNEEINFNSETSNPKELRERIDKEKELIVLLNQFEDINSSMIHINNSELDDVFISVVLDLNKDIEDLTMNDIIDILLSEVDHLKKENIAITDIEGNVIFYQESK